MIPSRTAYPRRRFFSILPCAMTVAACGLAASAVAPVAHAQSRQAAADLRSLVADLATQLRLAHRDNLPEYKRRYEQLRATVAAWNASSQSAADRQQLTSWLQDSIRRSMPGPVRPLPPPPTFAESASPSDAQAASRTGSPPQRANIQKPRVERAPEKTVVRKPAVDEEAAPASPPSNDSPNENEDGPDFWTEHPAAGDLPSEFPADDPFGDDPLF